jgi:hypothetical protein
MCGHTPELSARRFPGALKMYAAAAVTVKLAAASLPATNRGGLDHPIIRIFPTPGELQAEAEDHAKFVVTGTGSAYLVCPMKFKSVPAGSLSLLNRLKLRNRRPAPIGLTKSSMAVS